jgi:hypothetical protein
MVEMGEGTRIKLLMFGSKFYIRDRDWEAVAVERYGKWVALAIRRKS